MDLKEFGEYFADIRIKEGYRSQRSLSEKSGISYSTISRIELGTHRANPETLRELANCFTSVSYEQLLYQSGYADIESIIKIELDHLTPNRLKLSARFDDILEKLHLCKVYVRGQRLKKFLENKQINIESIVSNLDGVSVIDFFNILIGKKNIEMEDSIKLARYYRFTYSEMFVVQKAFHINNKFFDETKLPYEIDELIQQEILFNTEDRITREVMAEYAVSREIEPVIEDFIRIPIYGEIKAGYGMTGVENIIGYHMESKSRLSNDEHFYLKVKGDSMIDAGIPDGSLVLIRKQNTVEHGKIGVCIIDDEATLKRVFYDGDKVILKAENKGIQLKSYDMSEIRFQGQAVSVVMELL